MMPDILPCESLTGEPVSDAAKYINEQIDDDWQAMQGTQVLGNADLFDDLAELADECRETGWDGYGAAPVSQEAIGEASHFLRSLSGGDHRPTLGAEPDGQVTFEWHVSPNRTLSVSVSPDRMLHYAAMIGTSRHCGTVPFLGDCPHVIRELAQRVRQT